MIVNMSNIYWMFSLISNFKNLIFYNNILKIIEETILAILIKY